MDAGAVESSIRNSFLQFFDAREALNGVRVTLPYVLHDEAILSVRVEARENSYFITDDGMTLRHLDMSGVDLGDKKIWSTWEHLRQTAATQDGDTLTLSSESEDWELATTASVEGLGDAVVAIALTAMQVDGLSHFSGKTRSGKESFRDLAARELRDSIGAQYLLLPKQKMPSRVDGFEPEPWLTMRKGASGTEIYLEAVGGGEIRRKVEHAVTNFTMSSAGKTRQATVVEPSMDQNSSHARVLSTVSRLATPLDPDTLIGQIERLDTQMAV